MDSERREKHGQKCFCSPHIHPLFLWRGTKTGWTTSTTNTLDGLSSSSIGRTTIDKPHAPERGLSVAYHSDAFWER